MIGRVIVTLMVGTLSIVRHSQGMPTTMEKMTVSRMRMADLESSATGYVYDSQRGHPAGYVHYTNHGTGRYYASPPPIQHVHYGTPGAILYSEPSVISTLPNYDGKGSPLSPGYVVPLLQTPKKPALAPYYVSRGVHQDPHKTEIQVDEESGKSDEDESQQSEDNENDDGEEGGGKSFNDEENSSTGEKAEEVYENHDEFDKSENGEHDEERQEGHYSDEEGNKKSHTEDAGHYGKHDEAEESNEGESYGKQLYHKKGHKTTGFHNVYRKDEYKKDTKFYDDYHKSGRNAKNSSHRDHHASADGDYKKGGTHDSGYEENEERESGHHDKGHESSNDKGYKTEKGADSYHGNYSDYATNNGAKKNHEYGYNEGHP